MIVATQAQTIIQPPPNLLVNGNMDIWQRGTSFTSSTWRTNANGNCCVDRWKLFSDGDNIVSLSQSTDVPTGQGYQYSLLSTVVTINKKFGHIQFIPNTEAVKLAGRYVSIGFWAKTGASHVINNVRAAVLSFTGTADTAVSTKSGTAGSSLLAWSVQGTNPTQAATWTMENTATNLPLTTTWSHYTINNIYLDTANLTNLAVAIWVDDTDCAVGDLLYITGIDLVDNATWMQTAKRSFVDELDKCYPHFQKSYPYAIVPGTAGNAASANGAMGYLAPHNITYGQLQVFYGKMFGTPTLTVYSPYTGTSGVCRYGEGAGSDVVVVAINSVIGVTSTGLFTNTAVTGGNAITCHWTTEAEL